MAGRSSADHGPSFYDVLPSSANLHFWGKNDSQACPLYPVRGSPEHILSSCPVALGEGRYCWWHDQVLKTFAEAISSAVVNKKQTRETSLLSGLARSLGHSLDQLPFCSPSHRTGRLRFDLGRQLVSRPHYGNLGEARHGAFISLFKTGAPDTADSSLGGPYGRGK